MFKKVVLVVGLLGITGFLNPVYAQETKIISWVNCEMGDAVLRPLEWWQGGGRFGHVGVYFNSDSDGGGYNPKGEVPQITNSDMQHSVIHAPGGDPPRNLCVDSFDVFLDSKVYLGSYKYSDVKAVDRRDLVKWAHNEIGAPYHKKTWPGIKNAKGDEHPGWSFRCDGLVEWCYEEIKVGGGMGFFSDAEEKECWSPGIIKFIFGYRPKFYPMAFVNKMEKEEAEAPQIVTTELWKDGKQIDEYSTLTGIVTVKVKVMDGNTGSGIDKVV